MRGPIIHRGSTASWSTDLIEFKSPVAADGAFLLSNQYESRTNKTAKRRPKGDSQIQGASHFKFSDDGAMLKIPFVMGAMRTSGIVALDGRRQVALTARCISTFFDVYLKGAPASDLRQQLDCPEIEYAQ